ncbi:MAG: hypothetical protein HC906_17025, partial [Bacteroidales bacterium]|nr:hypothetical protein [Bacteroidales bacterium]
TDNDGITDKNESIPGTDPLDSDTDDDGIVDGIDEFPLNADEDTDTDNDGTGNNADTDDDNDGVLDVNDPAPLNADVTESSLAVVTSEGKSVGSTNAVLGGEAMASEGEQVSETGVVYSVTDTMPRIGSLQVSKKEIGSSLGKFETQVKNLIPDTTYYYRAYSINIFDTIYGSVDSITTGIVIYVNDDAAGNNDGSSWTDALTDLNEALAMASEGTEVWVAEGVYYPSDSDQDISFQLKSGVAVYGGFSGDETDFSERDLTLKPVLSGDIDKNEILDDGNSNHVVYADETDDKSVLDGFVITMGYQSYTGSNNGGGGVRCEDAKTQFRNLVITENYSDHKGGGFYAEDGDVPTLINCLFYNNDADFFGEDVFLSEDQMINVFNCTFENSIILGTGAGINAFNTIFTIEPDISFTGSPRTFNYTNCLLPEGSDALGTALLFGDAHFVDADNDDFRLTDSSSAYLTGDAKYAPETDIEGIPSTTPPNMGAYGDIDSDNDGLLNFADNDDDNDGTLDEMDAFPYDSLEISDTDNDGIGNVADLDDDGDGITDVEEGTLGTDPLKADTDEDGLSDGYEKLNGTDPLKPDTDTDGVSDKYDAFPNDPAQGLDTDGDGTSDVNDTDDDNDGVTECC